MLQKAETEYKDRPEISEVKHNQSSYDSSKTSCGRPSQLNLLILVIVMIINFARRCGVLWGRSFARNIKPPKKYLVTEAEEERVLGMAGKIPESEKLDRERQNDQMTEQSLKKSMVSEPKAGFKLLDMLEKVDKKQCRGCGAKFQFDDKTKEGHIDLKRLKPEDTDLKIEELIEKLVMQKANIDAGTDASLHEEPENAAQTNNMRQYTLEDYENDPLGLNSIEEVEALFEEKIVPKEICDRCVLINNGRYQELKEIEVNIERIPLDHFVTNIFKRIKEGSVVLMVLDATDIEGSIPRPYIKKLIGGDYELFIAINKVDCIPETITRERFKVADARALSGKGIVSQDNKHLALVSSKETIGLKKLVTSLKELKVSEQKKYIHTIGVTNAGKSSLLNSLRVASKKCNRSFYRVNPKYYKDPFDMKAAQQLDKEFAGDDFGLGKNAGELTVSFFPGTTLRSKEVEDIKLGTRVFDTPGLPTTGRVTDNVKHPEYLKHILMTKEPSLSRIVLDQGGALWFGGLARLDLVSGPSVGVVVFMSNEVTIVRNTIQKANLNYLKGFGKELFPTYTDSPQDTAFTRHPLKIRLSLKGSMNHEEVCIHGLGSFVFRQLEHTHVDGKVLELDLFLPPNVEFSVRPALLGIQEALTAKTTIRKAKRGNQSGIN